MGPAVKPITIYPHEADQIPDAYKTDSVAFLGFKEGEIPFGIIRDPVLEDMKIDVHELLSMSSADVFHDSIVLIYDIHTFLEQHHQDKIYRANLIRSINDLYFKLSNKDQYTKVLFVGPPMEIPEVLKSVITVVNYGVPTSYEICRILDLYKEKIDKITDLDDFGSEIRYYDQILDSLRGLTEDKIRKILDRIVGYNSINEEVLKQLSFEKNYLIKNSGLLEIYNHNSLPSYDAGGMKDLMSWLEGRKKIVENSDLAEQMGINDKPKGIMLIGIPGSGKSLVAKRIAKEWNYPLVRLDIGSIMDKWLGNSELRMRQALKYVENVSPCILWIDEFEKGMGDAKVVHSSRAHQNILATLLFWLQENGSPVFTVVTVDDLSLLPPELTRAGRFDAIFFLGCPGFDARKEIFHIHTTRFSPKLKLKDNEYDNLSNLSFGVTGAEIEQAIKNAAIECFKKDVKMSYKSIVQSTNTVRPLIRTLGKEIGHIWTRIESGLIQAADRDMLDLDQMLQLVRKDKEFPSYCRNEEIEGCTLEKIKASLYLDQELDKSPALVLFEFGLDGWIYGQANFKMHKNDAGAIKLTQTFDNLESDGQFIRLLEVYYESKVYFESQYLLNKFKDSLLLGRFYSQFNLLPSETIKSVRSHVREVARRQYTS